MVVVGEFDSYAAVADSHRADMEYNLAIDVLETHFGTFVLPARRNPTSIRL